MNEIIEIVDISFKHCAANYEDTSSTDAFFLDWNAQLKNYETYVFVRADNRRCLSKVLHKGPPWPTFLKLQIWQNNR